MECMVSGVTISTTSVYWYQERPGQAIQHLLHIFSNNTVKRESGILLSKFEAHMTPETSTLTLTVHNVQEQDSATYYCALWDGTSGQSIKVFGSGTQLIVTGKVSLNSVVRSGWEVGNTGTAGLSVGAGSEFSGLHPVW